MILACYCQGQKPVAWWSLQLISMLHVGLVRHAHWPPKRRMRGWDWLSPCRKSSVGPSRLCAACHGYPASTPSQGIKCTRVVPTRGWSRNCAQRLTSPPVFQLAPISSREAIKRPWHRQTRRCGKLLDLRRWRGQRHSFPRRRAGGESFILFCRWLKGQRYPHCQRKSKFPSSEFSGSRADSVRRTASSLSPATHLASGQESAVGGRQGLPTHL